MHIEPDRPLNFTITSVCKALVKFGDMKVSFGIGLTVQNAGFHLFIHGI